MAASSPRGPSRRRDGTVGVHLKLLVARGVTVKVHLGPAMFIGMNDSSFLSDDQVLVTGAFVAHDGEVALWARPSPRTENAGAQRRRHPRWPLATADDPDGCRRRARGGPALRAKMSNDRPSLEVSRRKHMRARTLLGVVLCRRGPRFRNACGERPRHAPGAAVGDRVSRATDAHRSDDGRARCSSPMTLQRWRGGASHRCAIEPATDPLKRSRHSTACRGLARSRTSSH